MTTTLQVPAPAPTATHKHLIDDALWERLTVRIRGDLQFRALFGELDESEQVSMSERIMDSTLGFLVLCGAAPASYGMAPIVDIGWHAFMLYTRDYADFCERVAGGFIHHSPHDAPTPDAGELEITRTVEAMRSMGCRVDEPL